MKRRLFTILTALSLLLCVAVVVLWGRSLFVGDKFFWHFCEDEGEHVLWVQDMVKVGWGGVGFNRIVQAMGPAGDRKSVTLVEKQYGPWPFHELTNPDYPHFKFGIMDEAKLGFKWGRFETQQSGGRGPAWGVQLVVPFWAILLLAGPLTFLLVRRYVMIARRKRTGLCPVCGYDLRATPERCPECGATPVQASA